MIEIGKINSLEIISISDIGAYLNIKGEGGVNSVLLPKKEVKKEFKVSDIIDVFIYKDSEDRLIATTKEPYIKLGEIKKLKVVDVSKIGAFLDYGLDRDLFLPFKEQIFDVKKNKEYMVMMYVDKSERLSATMKIYNHLSSDSPYKVNDRVRGIVYQIKDDMGILVAVDNKYHAMIPKRENFGNINLGDIIEARVTLVRDDGKLNISVRDKSYLQIDKDYELILNKLNNHNGFLPYNDKTDKDTISKEFSMSKRAFKKAVGRLLKEKKIEFVDNGIKLIKIQ